MTERPESRNILAFHRFRLALARHGRPPDGLEPAARADVERTAEAAAVLEDRVLSSAEADTVAIPGERIAESVGETESACGGDGAFSAVLAANDLDREAFAAGVRRELIFDGVMRAVAARTAPPPEAEVRAFYERNLEQFRVPETRTVRHILITVNPDFEENSRDAATRRVGELSKLLNKTPEAFEEVARTHSECPTALEDGLVGTVRRGVLYPEVEAVAFSLPPGAVSRPVETDMGFHLVRCDAVHPAHRRDFADVESEIHAHLYRTACTAAQKAWLATLSRRTSPPDRT